MLSYSDANEKLRALAATLNRIYIFDPFAAVATVFLIRVEPWGRKVTSFVDNEAARAPLTKGAAKNRVALTLAA